jgi:hypothetical protein
MNPPELEFNARGHHGLPQIPRAGGQAVPAPPEYRRAGCPDTLRVGACQDLVAMDASLPEVVKPPSLLRGTFRKAELD